MSDTQEAAKLAGDGTIAAAIVYAARKVGPALVQLVQLLYAIWEQREVDREKQDRRDRKRRRADSSLPPMTRGESVPEFVREESTDTVDVREHVQKRAPKGFRPPRAGTHHDGKKE